MKDAADQDIDAPKQRQSRRSELLEALVSIHLKKSAPARLLVFARIKGVNRVDGHDIIGIIVRRDPHVEVAIWNVIGVARRNSRQATAMVIPSIAFVTCSFDGHLPPFCLAAFSTPAFQDSPPNRRAPPRSAGTIGLVAILGHKLLQQRRRIGLLEIHRVVSKDHAFRE